MNSNTQNKKIEAITEKTLVIGINVGSETHFARAFDHRGFEYSKKPFKFSNNEAGFETFKAWITDIKETHEKDKVVPGMEPTGHYWFNLGKLLQDNEMKPVLVENSSGKHKGETTISRRGRKRLRYLLFEVAMSLVGKNPEFGELHHYYTARKQNPLKKMQSLMAVAAKAIRVFYAILTKGVDYNPAKMLEDIKRPGMLQAV